jgi:RecJ-like exonuclease
MDHRDIAANYRRVLHGIDRKRMVAYFTDMDDDGNETEVKVRLKFELCSTCDGRGSHVNPSIDAHGLSREDFDDDPDFAEDYFSGRYDVPCNECHGANVVPVVDTDPRANAPAVVARYEELEADAWGYAREIVREREMGC